jgi:hypothetical protein
MDAALSDESAGTPGPDDPPDSRRESLRTSHNTVCHAAPGGSRLPRSGPFSAAGLMRAEVVRPNSRHGFFRIFRRPQ